MFEGLLSPTHLLLILLIAMILLGPKKLPELGKGLGEAIRGFRESMRAPEVPQAPKDAGVPPMQAVGAQPKQAIAAQPAQPFDTQPAAAPAPGEVTPSAPKLPAS